MADDTSESYQSRLSPSPSPAPSPDDHPHPHRTIRQDKSHTNDIMSVRLLTLERGSLPLSDENLKPWHIVPRIGHPDRSKSKVNQCENDFNNLAKDKGTCHRHPHRNSITVHSFCRGTNNSPSNDENIISCLKTKLSIFGDTIAWRW